MTRSSHFIKIEAEFKGLQKPSKDPDVKAKLQVKAMDAELKSEFCKLQGTVYNLVDKFDEFQKHVDFKMSGNRQKFNQISKGHNHSRGQVYGKG